MNASSAKPEVLVIDDEFQIRRLLRVTLEAAGYDVREADGGRVGLNEIAHRRPDAVILDLGLPDLPGAEVLRRLRDWCQVPVLVLSVSNDEREKIAVLDAGADDYLTKPFGSGELLARLRVLRRRTQAPEEARIVRFGMVQADLVNRVITKDGAVVRLTAKEYALLRLLLVHRDGVVTQAQALRDVWGPNAADQTHYLCVYMARLRQKLEEDPSQPRFLRTEPGVGYRLCAG